MARRTVSSHTHVCVLRLHSPSQHVFRHHNADDAGSICKPSFQIPCSQCKTCGSHGSARSSGFATSDWLRLGASTARRKPARHRTFVLMSNLRVFVRTPRPTRVKNGQRHIAQATEDSGERRIVSAQKQFQTAIDTREQVADEIVRELQSMGLRASARGWPCTGGEPERTGRRRQFLSRRSTKASVAVASLIGLGAFGKSRSELPSVQILYKPAAGTPIALQSFSANADSGHMPGIVETAGVGAAAGHVATAAATGTALHGASEVKQDGVSSDAKKLGDSIAKQIAAASTANGWMSAERID